MTTQNIYQQAVYDMYAAIAGAAAIKTIKAQYNAVIEGRTETHEADIYWEFTDGDIIYKILIQAKEQVSLGELFSFLRIVRDIPGQVMGVIVTQPVYKKDVKDMAANAGIILYELLAPLTAGIWEPVISNIRINVDAAWVKAAKEQAGLGDEMIQMNANPKYTFLYDENGNCVDSVQGVFDYYGKERNSAGTEQEKIVHSFAEPVFLQTHHEMVPFIKLDNITFDLEFVNANQMPGEEMLGQVFEKTLKYFGH
ncbi:hypothetical protein [Sporomusa termitida]|uniref:Restriction endonuclease type IV Mrr domain-containing protein n=1 Tax=Sporomusa termitida TaxID=2377 RepID=A0A517E076_9FIRM|nr:hypothetical protein [Sporomusa termitida]QDR83009.1 hypothetical protein SPTER_44630 [Sporomusa termitida]